MHNSVATCLALLAFLQTPAICSAYNDKVILSQMQEWGKKVFRLIENDKAKGQYLVAALLSDDDLNKPNEMSKKLLKGCPSKGPDKAGKMIECSTSAVLLNRVSEGIWKNSPWKNEPQYKDHPWHGEYMLVNEGIIDRLIDNFQRENGEKAKCRVYLYSYFIPCADIFGCPYSCSDQVAAYKNRAGTTCRITVIGYTEVFRRSNTMKTNEVRAADVIKAQMDLYHTTRDVTLIAVKAARANNLEVPFQEYMFTCLYESPLARCCVDDSDTRQNSKLVIAYFVNKLVHKAINDEKFAKNSLFSDRSRKDLLKYLSAWINTQIDAGCGKCNYVTYNVFLIEFCAKTALELTSGFGSPTPPYDLSSANWKSPESKGKYLYSVSPEQFLNTKKVQCALKSLSIDSLCTRLQVNSIILPGKRSRSRSPPMLAPKASRFDD